MALEHNPWCMTMTGIKMKGLIDGHYKRYFLMNIQLMHLYMPFFAFNDGLMKFYYKHTIYKMNYRSQIPLQISSF